MPEKNIDVPNVIALLSRHNIRFVLIGGYAMVAQGSEYQTQDIDIAYSRKREDIAAFAVLLHDCNARLRGLPPELPAAVDERLLKNAVNLTLQTDFGDLDILAEPEGVDSFEGLWERADVMQIFGYDVRVASVEDLLAMKRAANRPKDQLHIAELLKIQKLIREEGNLYSVSPAE